MASTLPVISLAMPATVQSTTTHNVLASCPATVYVIANMTGDDDNSTTGQQLHRGFPFLQLRDSPWQDIQFGVATVGGTVMAANWWLSKSRMLVANTASRVFDLLMLQGVIRAVDDPLQRAAGYDALHGGAATVTVTTEGRQNSVTDIWSNRALLNKDGTVMEQPPSSVRPTTRLKIAAVYVTPEFFKTGRVSEHRNGNARAARVAATAANVVPIPLTGEARSVDEPTWALVPFTTEGDEDPDDDQWDDIRWGRVPVAVRQVGIVGDNQAAVTMRHPMEPADLHRMLYPQTVEAFTRPEGLAKARDTCVDVWLM